jgi:hypothetical protein
MKSFSSTDDEFYQEERDVNMFILKLYRWLRNKQRR